MHLVLQLPIRKGGNVKILLGWDPNNVRFFPNNTERFEIHSDQQKMWELRNISDASSDQKYKRLHTKLLGV